MTCRSKSQNICLDFLTSRFQARKPPKKILGVDYSPVGKGPPLCTTRGKLVSNNPARRDKGITAAGLRPSLTHQACHRRPIWPEQARTHRRLHRRPISTARTNKESRRLSRTAPPPNSGHSELDGDPNRIQVRANSSSNCRMNSTRKFVLGPCNFTKIRKMK